MSLSHASRGSRRGLCGDSRGTEVEERGVCPRLEEHLGTKEIG